MLDALTLDQMRVFVCVAETGSFSAAARRLGRVQSAISQSIKTMETTLRLELFERDGKTPRVTPAGAALLREAMDILNDVDAFKRRAESISSGFAPQLTLAVDQVFPSSLLIESLQAFRKEFPLIPVTLFTEGLGATEQRLRTNLARLAIYSPLLAEPAGLEMEFLAKVRIVPVVAASHPLAQKKGMLSRSEIRRHVQLVLTDRAQAVHGLVLSSHYWRFADQYSRLEHLQHGFGWSFAPLHLVRSFVARSELKILSFEIFNGMSLSLPLYMVYLQGQRLDHGMNWLIRYLRNRLVDYKDTFIQPEDEDKSIPYPLEAIAGL
jgi:DNA-binding transcriptional LysR family regulator